MIYLPKAKQFIKLALTHHLFAPNIVSSLAEKAMSVAAPVVPTKKDGEWTMKGWLLYWQIWGKKVVC